ncbi:MAG: hypothetical protein BroJett040_19450 [Oligoflexia bacterium]|nr:MAG: hypothetical protein BroJett040_19450 [Oligoflexia bacterium]
MSTLELNQQQKDEFWRSVVYSLGVHITLFFILTVKTVFFPGEPISYQAAVRVDLVALPDKMSPEEKISQAPAEPVKETPKEVTPPKPTPPPVKTDDTVNLGKTKDKQKAALDKLKAMSALEDINKQVEQERRSKTPPKVYKGNQLSSGTELTGLSKLQHETYIAQVERHIKQNWAVPQWLAQKNLKAQVRVRFDERGNLLSNDIYRSSGNPSFDEIALETVQKSAPVPPPPEKFVRILSSEGILFGFPE